jgi:hypothetical protein
MVPQLPPSENRVRAEGIEPRQHTDVVTLFANTQPGPERASRLFRIASMFQSLSEMGIEFLVDLAVESASA